MAVHGKTGYVVFGSTTVCATDWTIDRTADEVDITQFCGGTSGGEFKEYMLGFKDGSGTFTTLVDTTDYFGSSGTISLGNSSVVYSGSVLFNSAGANNPVDGRYEETYGFRFTGAVTKA